jgi:hypothetical protein
MLSPAKDPFIMILLRGAEEEGAPHAIDSLIDGC